MRLLSIFALLFLISFVLHDGGKDQLMPEEKPLEQEQEPDETPLPVSEEDFSGLIFKQPYPVRHFDFEQESSFSVIDQEIKNLIVDWKKDDSFMMTNHFCAVGYEFPRNPQDRKKERFKKEVVVYWRERRALFRWTGGNPEVAKTDFYYARSLIFSRSIPLDGDPDGDKEASQNDPAIDKARIGQLIADCDKHGKQYTIEPFAPPPRGFRPPPPPTAPRPPRPSPAPQQGTSPDSPSPAAPPPFP